MKLRFYVFLFLLIPLVSFSQKKDTHTISFENESLDKVIAKLAKTYGVRFSYQDRLLGNKFFTLKEYQLNLSEILTFLEMEFQIEFQKITKKSYIILEIKSTLSSVQQLDNVVINDYLNSGIYKNKSAAFKIDLNSLAILPGLIETDIIESIQQLPGVISPNETATSLIVRGGANDQNRVIWDGINSYHNGHLFGMISAFNPNMPKSVTFYNKGTHPRYGERISSVTNIETSNRIIKRPNVSFDVNGINSSVNLKTPIVDRRLSLQAGYRRSYTELYESVTFRNFSQKVFQNTKIRNPEANRKSKNNDFFFSDYNFKINYKSSEKNQFYLSTFFINNGLDFVVKDVESDLKFNDILTTKNEGYSIRWNKKWNEKITHSILGSFSKYNLNYNYITFQSQDQISDFEKRNAIFETSINSDIAIKINQFNQLNFGYQYNFKDVSFAFLDSSEVNLVLDQNQILGTTHAFYSSFSYYNDKFFDFEGGFRVNYFTEINELKFEPRFVIHKKILKNLKLQLTGELKNQAISQIDETILSDLSLENKIWRLADGKTYPLINSYQFSAGLIYNNNDWSFDVDFYNKEIKGLTALSLGFLNPNDNNIHLGKQKIKGIDFYVKKNFHQLKMWLSYSLSDVKSRFDGINSEKYFNANNAILHTGSLSAAYKLKQFEIALGFNIHSGKPYTKAIESVSELLEFREVNGENFPTYHRLDFSSTYRFKFTKKNKLKGKIGFSIRNLYDKNNQISKDYTGNNSINDPIQINDKFSLGITPNFLFKVYW